MNKNLKWMGGLSLAVFAASGLVYTGCTVTSGTVDDDGGIVRPTSDSGTDGSTNTDGGGTDAATDSGGQGCTQLKSTEKITQSTRCNTCLENKCCSQLVGCLDLADAGAVTCKQYDQCVGSCIDQADGGDPQTCIDQQCNLASSTEVQNAHKAVVTCANTSCNAECQ